jgi:hypothetical protein
MNKTSLCFVFYTPSRINTVQRPLRMISARHRSVAFHHSIFFRSHLTNLKLSSSNLKTILTINGYIDLHTQEAIHKSNQISMHTFHMNRFLTNALKRSSISINDQERLFICFFFVRDISANKHNSRHTHGL